MKDKIIKYASLINGLLAVFLTAIIAQALGLTYGLIIALATITPLIMAVTWKLICRPLTALIISRIE